jgi:RecA-family ATPase
VSDSEDPTEPTLDEIIEAAGPDPNEPPSLDELEAMAIAQLAALDEAAKPPKPTLDTFTAAELAAMDLPEPRFACAGLVMEGLSFLAGAPKLGKSWLALQLAVAVAFGDDWLGEKCEKGAVLYLALEDSKRRLQSRLQKILDHRIYPPTLHMATECPRLDEGGLDRISTWLKAHPDARLVVIDTLAKVKPRRKKNGDVYAEDSAAGAQLQKLAFEHRAALLVVTHTRKAPTEDFLEEVSGTLGLTGAADSVLVLKRDRQAAEGTLSLTGRDIEERELALAFTSRDLWTLVGAAADVRMSQERREILEALRASDTAMTPVRLAQELDKNRATTRRLLQMMKLEGHVHAGPKSGTYLPGPSC